MWHVLDIVGAHEVEKAIFQHIEEEKVYLGGKNRKNCVINSQTT